MFLSNTVSVFADGSVNVAPSAPPSIIWTGYRARHKTEGGRITPDGMPCVLPSINVDGVQFTGAIQQMSYELMIQKNYTITRQSWRVVYGGGTAFCNREGFDDPRTYVRRDYVNGKDLAALIPDTDKPAFPKLMKAIVCAGNFFTGQISGDELVMTPGVDAIDGNKPLPPLAEIIERHWYFHATTARQTSTGWKVSNFPQGNGAPVLIPYILRERARYSLSWFTPWNSVDLPEPTRIYL